MTCYPAILHAQTRQAVSAGAIKGARAVGGAAARSADAVGGASKAMSAGAKKVGGALPST